MTFFKELLTEVLNEKMIIIVVLDCRGTTSCLATRFANTYQF